MEAHLAISNREFSSNRSEYVFRGTCAGEKTRVSENTQCRNFFQIIPVFLLRVRRRSLEVD